MSAEVNFNNKYRVLLTELLPYELPFRLSNDVFYDNMQNTQLRTTFDETIKVQGKKPSYTVPFDYYVRRSNSKKSRKLSVMHPFAQMQFVDFYDKYADHMLYLCSNNPFSIRHISKKAQCIFKAENNLPVKDDMDEEQHVEFDNEDVETRYRSYFRYEHYGLIYKFFSSGDYLRLEQKYAFMMKMDIASCFYNIYTHTISWAVKDKAQAKMHADKEAFENSFDKLIRSANYNETNGILVGPEVSRIFAEIILSKIDVLVLSELRKGSNVLKSLQVGKDYEVRRYVDDYFIYANSNETLDRILSVYKEQLEYYKLYINESKLEYISRPFGADLGDAKIEISKMLNNFKSKYLMKEDGIYVKPFCSSYKAFINIATEFRTIAHRHNLTYGELNKYALKLLMYQIVSEMASGAVSTVMLLLAYVDIAFYIFSLDMSVSASYKVCRIIDYVVRWAKTTNSIETKMEVENRISREAKRCMDIYQAQTGEKDTNLEMLNLLLMLKQITLFHVSENQLQNVFGLNNSSDSYKSLNYFQICTLLFLMGNENKYRNIKMLLIDEIKHRLDKSNNIFLYAETSMLFFDMMTCPYVEAKDKKVIIKKSIGCKDEKISMWLSEYNKTNRWFFDWDTTKNISFFLDKKEYHSPYE